MWQAPKAGESPVTLTLEVASAEPNTLVVRIDSFATELSLAGANQWETFALFPSDFKNASGVALESWKDLQQLELAPFVSIKSSFDNDGIKQTDRLRLGASNWKGAAPEFKQLSWGGCGS